MHVNQDNLHGRISFQSRSANKAELIHRATRQGRIFSLETYLNQSPPVNIDQQFEHGRSRWTILIAACFYKHENIVRLLLRRFQPKIDASGDVKLEFVHEVMCGVSALWVAVAVGHFGLVKLLVEEGGADVNHLSTTRSSPLRAASYIGHLDIARYLIGHGAEMRLVREGNYTNLMLSAYREHTQLVRYFLDELGADPNERDQDGRQPLHYAIDGGSVEVIRVLLEHGAANQRAEAVSPMSWAALEAREDLVAVFEAYCSSMEEWIETRELLGASYASIESKNYNLSKAIEHLTLAYQWRSEKNLPKQRSALPPIEAFSYQQECQTLVEFNQLLSQPNTRMHIESLLIQERILGPNNRRFRRAVRFYGALLADTHQYDTSLALWLYELDLRRQHDIPFDRWHLRDIVHMFAEMINYGIERLSEKALLDVLRALDEELVHHRHHDHNLLTLFHLITVISHLLEEQKFSPSMKDVYRLLSKLIQRGYTTADNDQGSTLLHLSMMVGLPCVHDRHMMALCK